MASESTNIAEEYVKLVNDNIFLSEFTFSENEIKINQNEEIELADNIVWLDEIVLLIQIKSRNNKKQGNFDDEAKWFKNQVLNKAKKQIKSTINHINTLEKIEIKNGKGFIVDLHDIPINNAKKIIIYLPSDGLSEQERFLKFYASKEVNLIHLLHFEDYKWICQYLITPYEIWSYFQFREDLHNKFSNNLNLIPEQLILGMYLSGEDIYEIEPRYINYLTRFEADISEFDISQILLLFSSKTMKQDIETDYVSILKEIAKLTRFELKEFKQRLMRSVEKSKMKDYSIPYRVTFPRTGIGFVFIPLPLGDKKLIDNWKNALQNFTLAHKYDQRLTKCVGVIIFNDGTNSDYIEMYWAYIDFTWSKDEILENALSENFPFRQVREVEMEKYKFKEE